MQFPRDDQFLSRLPSLTKHITLRGFTCPSCLEDLDDLQLGVDVARRLQLAATAHIPYSTLFVSCSCLLARTTHVAVAVGALTQLHSL
jgi:hypothetical protein